MNGNISIQIKAGFLLAVFSLNTLVGFACSMGLKMKSGSSHHGMESNNEIHIHKNGKKHVHNKVPEKNHHANESVPSKTDDCCNGNVVKLQTADKNFQYSKTSINTPVSIILTCYIASITFKKVQPNLQEFVACHFHPPPRDIRIDIQSFQI